MKLAEARGVYAGRPWYRCARCGMTGVVHAVYGVQEDGVHEVGGGALHWGTWPGEAPPCAAGHHLWQCWTDADPPAPPAPWLPWLAAAVVALWLLAVVTGAL